MSTSENPGTLRMRLIDFPFPIRTRYHHFQHASQCSGDTSISSGSELMHFSPIYGHLAAKRQIGFGSIGECELPIFLTLDVHS